MLELPHVLPLKQHADDKARVLALLGKMPTTSALALTFDPDHPARAGQSGHSLSDVSLAAFGSNPEV